VGVSAALPGKPTCTDSEPMKTLMVLPVVVIDSKRRTGAAVAQRRHWDRRLHAGAAMEAVAEPMTQVLARAQI
jgi:hypothetical protein